MMRIGELSKRTGVSVRSLRYYDKQNLLPTKREKNGYRYFDEECVERVRLIQFYFGLGLNSCQIEQILRCKDENKQPEQEDLCDELLTLYHRRLQEVNEELTLLLDIKNRLLGRIKGFEQRIREHEYSK
jgi:DNA-binding transcriptional MerR regulator